MDDLIQHASAGITTPSRASSHSHLSHPPTAPSTPPTPTMATTKPDPNAYTTKLKGARTALIADDFPTATKLSYELLESPSVPFWAKAQASLIITAYDAYPGTRPAYIEAVGIVESTKGMSQEQVEPNYKSLQIKIDEKQRMGSMSSVETRPPLRMEQSQIGGTIAGRELSGINDRDVGMALRKMDREQSNGAGGCVGSEERTEDTEGKQDAEVNVQEGDDGKTNDQADGEAPKKAKLARDCSCIVI